MKPIEFKHQNVVYAEGQDEYLPLPALKINSHQGEVVSCWKMSFRERLKVLLTGRVWVSLCSFNKPLTPYYVSVDRKGVYSMPSDKNGLFKRLKNKFV